MACSSFRALLFWCREVLLLLFCQQQQQRQQPSSISLIKFPQVFSSSRVSEVTLGTFSVRFWACSSFRPLLFWCREVLLLLFCQQQQQQQQQQRQQPSRISHKFPQVFSSSKRSRSHVRHFFGAILGPVRPSVPCCFGARRCFWYSSVSSSSSNGSSRLVSLISSLRSSILVELAAV